MTRSQKVDAFKELGIFISNHLTGAVLPGFEELHVDLEKAIEMSFVYNGWFTRQGVEKALASIAEMLCSAELSTFAEMASGRGGKEVAVIMAGNIPMVGFHDLLCVLLSGNRILIKTSSDDGILMPVLCNVLCKAEPAFSERIRFADGKIGGFDAVIATGNNNSARYFEYYFSKYPNIIRKNRNSVAVLSGNETREELRALGSDIFMYFGLGCRNVSHLLVPKGYNFNAFFESVFSYAYVADNKKYGNNYDYHRALFLLEGIKFLDNNFLILKEDTSIASPVSVLHHQSYDTEAALKEILETNEPKIQCIVGNASLNHNYVGFGKSQSPGIYDFADRVNTIEFLNKLG